MRLSFPLSTLVLSTLVAADGLSLFGGQKTLAGQGAAVPGDNPLTFCQVEHDSDLLVLDYVNLSPNPPVPGQTLTIEAVGSVLKDIGKGAYVNLQVKYGLIKLLSTRADLCEQVSNVDLECPIQKGKISITKGVEIPEAIPPGKYTVSADAYTAADEKIVCLDATVAFG